LWLEIAYKTTPAIVAGVVEDRGLKLAKSGEGSAKRLENAVQVAIEKAFKKPYKHLAEDVSVRDAKGRMTKVRCELEIFQRRVQWRTTALPAASSDHYAAWATRALGKAPDLAFAHAYTRFHDDMEANELGLPVPAADAKPAALIQFWRAVKAKPEYSVVGKAALRALSIPVSQAVVERSFSQLTNREAPNRLKAGSKYVIDMMMLAVNRPYLPVLLAKAATLMGK